MKTWSRRELMLYILVASHEATQAIDVVQYMKKDFGFYYMFPWYRGINSQYPSTNQLLKANAATEVKLEAIYDYYFHQCT